jgi:hypothetical protein
MLYSKTGTKLHVSAGSDHHQFFFLKHLRLNSPTYSVTNTTGMTDVKVKGTQVLRSWAKASKEKELGVTGVTFMWQNGKERC